MLRQLRGWNSSGLGRKLPLGIAAVFFLSLLLFCANSGWAQVLYGTVTGNVTDQSGAVVPGAEEPGAAEPGHPTYPGSERQAIRRRRSSRR